MLRNNVKQDKTSAIVADETVANRHIDPGQVGQKISLFSTRVETLAADKHAIAKLPLVRFRIISLTRLTAGVCMKVSFKSKVTRGFSFSPLRDSFRALRKKRKNQDKLLGPGYDVKICRRNVNAYTRTIYKNEIIKRSIWFRQQDLRRENAQLF